MSKLRICLGVLVLLIGLAGTTGCKNGFLEASDCIPAAQLVSISPDSARAHGVFFVMTLQGTGFDNRTLVYFNNSAVPTTFDSPTVLHAVISSDMIRNVGTVPVYAEKVPFTDPSNGLSCNRVADSNSLNFTITN